MLCFTWLLFLLLIPDGHNIRGYALFCFPAVRIVILPPAGTHRQTLSFVIVNFVQQKMQCCASDHMYMLLVLQMLQCDAQQQQQNGMTADKAQKGILGMQTLDGCCRHKITQCTWPYKVLRPLQYTSISPPAQLLIDQLKRAGRHSACVFNTASMVQVAAPCLVFLFPCCLSCSVPKENSQHTVTQQM